MIENFLVSNCDTVQTAGGGDSFCSAWSYDLDVDFIVYLQNFLLDTFTGIVLTFAGLYLIFYFFKYFALKLKMF